MKIKFNIMKGDRVIIITGRDKGKISKVLKINCEKKLVLVEKVNIIKRHYRATKTGKGGIIEKEAFFSISNVMIICNKCAKPVRVNRKVLDSGKKIRICKKCGESVT